VTAQEDSWKATSERVCSADFVFFSASFFLHSANPTITVPPAVPLVLPLLDFSFLQQLVIFHLYLFTLESSLDFSFLQQ
jgi:hypothetical protein